MSMILRGILFSFPILMSTALTNFMVLEDSLFLQHKLFHTHPRHFSDEALSQEKAKIFHKAILDSHVNEDFEALHLFLLTLGEPN